MQSSGIQSQQVSQVRGFSDQRPRVKESPDDSSNRRISLIVEYLNKTPPENAAAANSESEAKGESGKSSGNRVAAVSTEKK
jgi:chemotaxis protein MotB